MKKIFLILILIFVYSHSSTLNEIKIKLISQISHALINRKNIKIFISDKKFLNCSNCKGGDIEFVKDCKKADVIVSRSINDIDRSCLNKIIFCTSYRDYKSTDLAFGAIFWQKGRPNLILNVNSIKKRGINLPKSLKKYLDN